MLKLIVPTLLFQIYFHGQDLESLHAHIEPKFLPRKYGGMRPEYNYTDWLDSLVYNHQIVSGGYNYYVLVNQNLKSAGK